MVRAVSRCLTNNAGSKIQREDEREGNGAVLIKTGPGVEAEQPLSPVQFGRPLEDPMRAVQSWGLVDQPGGIVRFLGDRLGQIPGECVA